MELEEKVILDAIAAATGCGLVLLDRGGVIVYCSPQIEELASAELDCRVGQPWSELLLPVAGLEAEAEAGLLRALNFYQVNSPGGEPTWRLGVLRLTSNYSSGREDYFFTAENPEGIPSSRALRELLQRQLAYQQRYQTPFSLLFLKIRNFQTFVEVLGEHSWNITVRAVYDQLLAIVRMADCVGLYDDSTYWVVLTNTSREGAMVVVDKIERLAGSMKVEAIDIFLSVIVGGVEAQVGENLETLIARALAVVTGALKPAVGPEQGG